jgi:ankyrin repeat protein
VRQAVEADPSLANSGGAHNIPLIFHAAIGGNYELARFLADRGADTGPAVSGSLLHAAIRANHAEMAAWALSLGADPDALDFENKTARQHAEELGRADIVALLQH